MVSPLTEPIQPMSEPSCPACDRPKDPVAAECPHCGVIYARARPRASAAKPAPKAPPKPAQPADGERPVLRIALPSARRQNLFTTIAEALDAGLTFGAYVEGAAVRTLPAALVEALRRDAKAGCTISDTLRRLRILDLAATALLEAAERRGEIPEALRVLARREAEVREFRHRVLRKLSYPCMILVASAVLFPLPKLFTSGLGAYAGAVLGTLWPLVVLAALGLGVYPRLDPDSPIRAGVRRLGGRVPPFSQISKHVALATFADVLGASLSAGLAMRRSLVLAADATGHGDFTDHAESMLRHLDGGATLVDTLEKSVPELPSGYLALIGHGELVGKLTENLGRLSIEHKAKAQRLVTTMIVIAGAIASMWVVYQVIAGLLASYQGYFQLMDSSVDSMMR